jgi:hypothetical protein
MKSGSLMRDSDSVYPSACITVFLHAAVARKLSHGGIMSLQAHIETLKERHASLDARISDEDHRPRPDSETLVRLKVEKLRVKEEMERLRSV